MRKFFTASVCLCLSFFSSRSQSYQYYFGTLHAHSSYSDGNQNDAVSGVSIPAQSYSYAKSSYNFNFLGISDHNHKEAGMHLADYKKGLYQADTSTKIGQFVSLFGFEYGTLSRGGHVIVYGMDSLVGWEAGNYDIYNATADYQGLFNIINKHPGAFGSFAHPDNTDFNNIVSTPYQPLTDQAVIGTAIRNGNAYSPTTDYSDHVPSTVYFQYYRRLLAKGYHVGALIDHDNHYTTFGRTGKSRTVVLSQQLSKDSILAACRAMRFYASDDWNTKITFTANGYPMGSSVVTTNSVKFQIVVTDPDKEDTTAEIILHYGVPGSDVVSTAIASATGSENMTTTLTLAPNSSFYYFAEFTQKDGDKIFTSPIWVTTSDDPMPLYALNIVAKQQGTEVTLAADISASLEKRKLVWQKGYTGSDFKDLSTPLDSIFSDANFYLTDKNLTAGWQYYRLKIIEANGSVHFSNIEGINYIDKSFQLLSLSPNPARSVLKVSVAAQKATSSQYSIYSSDGRLIVTKAISLIQGLNTYPLNVSVLPIGTYIFTISTPAGILESKFIKIN